MYLEPLGVDAAALRGYGTDLVIAAGDIPAAPAAFTVTGGDAISQKISSLLPSIEGPILDGLPQVKGEAQSTADRVVSAADTYQRVDDELAGKVREAVQEALGTAGTGGGGGGAGGAGTAAAGGAPASGGSAAGAGGAAAGGSATGGSAAGGADAMSQMGQMMSMPMQLASQAVQIPMQALGALAAVPQAIMQGVQQVSQAAGGLGDEEEPVEKAAEETRAEDEKKPEEAAAERPDAERAPVEPPVAQTDPNVAPQPVAPEKQPAQTRPADL
jgi:hypothetical protein